jgi:hypothetical protein
MSIGLERSVSMALTGFDAARSVASAGVGRGVALTVELVISASGVTCTLSSSLLFSRRDAADCGVIIGGAISGTGSGVEALLDRGATLLRVFLGNVFFSGSSSMVVDV